MAMSKKLLDRYDLAILRTLENNGRMTTIELADRIGLSKTPCHARIKRLETQGYIKGYAAVLNQELMGNKHVAFVQVKLKDTRAHALKAFNEAVQSVPVIEECHMMASDFDYILKVRTTDIATYREILGETITALPFVASTSTFVAMEIVKEHTHVF
jgi:Lrp/AsnC family leucine-responsive transcriptional regulator